jgi:hypothetical protein
LNFSKECLFFTIIPNTITYHSIKMPWTHFKGLLSQNCGCVVRFEVFTAVTIQVKVFWIVIPCSVVVRY